MVVRQVSTFDLDSGTVTDTPPSDRECKKCAGDPEAKRHGWGCPNSPSKGDKAPRGTGKRTALKPRLQETIGAVGLGVTALGGMAGNPRVAFDGAVVLDRAEPLAEALDALAKENPRVRKTLEMVLASSAWSGVAVASAGIVIPILANHGIIPRSAAMAVGVEIPMYDAFPSPEANGSGGSFS